MLVAVDELSFLGMECERLGAIQVCERVLSAYAHATADLPSPTLVAFYKARRATLRANLMIEHLKDPQSRAAHWRNEALAYLGAAERYAAQIKETLPSKPQTG